MIMLNYLVFLGVVALDMACVAGLLITEKVILSLRLGSNLSFK